MNVQNIVSEIEKLDPEVYDRLDSRRSAMRRFAFAGKVLAAAAIPTALGSLFKKAYGQSSSGIESKLHFEGVFPVVILTHSHPYFSSFAGNTQ